MNNIFIHHSSVFVLLSDVPYQAAAVAAAAAAAASIYRLDVTR